MRRVSVERLAQIIRNLPPLEQKRRPLPADWPWSAFIQAFATNGGVRHWEKNIKPQRSEYAWNKIVQLPRANRLKKLTYVANPRWRAWKNGELRNAKFLNDAFEKYKRCGGPTGVKRQYQSLSTAEERIAWLKGFDGIGDKYSRDIPMDADDPKFRNGYFALDARLNSILKASGNYVPSYRDREKFLEQIARRVGIDCRTLDRLLFKEANYKVVLAAVRKITGKPPDVRRSPFRHNVCERRSMPPCAED